jgi:hypothetical protein
MDDLAGALALVALRWRLGIQELQLSQPLSGVD